MRGGSVLRRLVVAALGLVLLIGAAAAGTVSPAVAQEVGIFGGQGPNPAASGQPVDFIFGATNFNFRDRAAVRAQQDGSLTNVQLTVDLTGTTYAYNLQAGGGVGEGAAAARRGAADTATCGLARPLTVVCTQATLAPGASIGVFFTVVVVAPPGTPITQTVTFSGLSEGVPFSMTSTRSSVVATPLFTVAQELVGPPVRRPLQILDPTFLRPFGGSGAYPYDAYTVQHPGGQLNADVQGAATGVGTLVDPYVCVYTTFNPATPMTGLVGCDDDTDVSLEADFFATLPAGAYTIVVTGFAPSDTGTYLLTVSTSPAGVGPDALGARNTMRRPKPPK